jgi:D-citramalate synthase
VLKRIVELGTQTSHATETSRSSSPRSWRAGIKLLELLACTFTSSLGLTSTASLKIRIQGEELSAAGSGNGGYDAFIGALTKVLKKKGLTLPELADFEVRIPKGGRTDALTECIIAWDDNGSEVKTRGVHTNQVFAAIYATLRMLNILLHRRLHPAARKAAD